MDIRCKLMVNLPKLELRKEEEKEDLFSANKKRVVISDNPFS